MSVTAAEVEALWPPDEFLRVPMEFEEWEKLREGVRVEWVDGFAVMSPPPTLGHGRVLSRLMYLLHDAFPDFDILQSVGYRAGERRYRIPDLLVLAERPDEVRYVRSALVAVEVLSPSTRSEDAIRKAAEYLAAGTGQYWIVDVDEPRLTVLGNAGAEWEFLADLTAGRPEATVEVGSHGPVTLNLPDLLR